MNISEERIAEIINRSKCLNGDNAALWAKTHGVEQKAAEHIRKNRADSPGAIGIYMSTFNGDPARYIIVLHVAGSDRNPPFWQIIGIDRSSCTKEEANEVLKAMVATHLDMIREAIKERFPNADINEKFVGGGDSADAFSFIQAEEQQQSEPPQEGFGA